MHSLLTHVLATLRRSPGGARHTGPVVRRPAARLFRAPPLAACPAPRPLNPLAHHPRLRSAA